MQFWLIVDHDLNLLAALIETIAHGSILGCQVLSKGHILSTGFLHILSTLDQSLDVEASTGNGQQAYRCEHREASAHIVGNNETLIAFLVSTGTGSTALGIGHSHNHLLSLLLAALSLALLLQQAEGQGRLGGGTRLRDINHAKLLAFQVFCHLKQVVLANVVACEKNRGVLAVLDEPAERVAQGFYHGTGTQIGTADAGNDHHLAILAERVGASLNLIKESRGNRRWQMKPSKEIVTRACAVLKGYLCCLHLRFESSHCAFCQEAGGLCNVKTDILHIAL